MSINIADLLDPFKQKVFLEIPDKDAIGSKSGFKFISVNPDEEVHKQQMLAYKD